MNPVRKTSIKARSKTKTSIKFPEFSNGMNTFEEVYSLVSKIPEGRVTTYGVIAKKLGIPNPRVVGYALHANSDPNNVPCHRVVNAKGELARGYAFGGSDIQKQLLIQEGIHFDQDRVVLAKHLFIF